MTFLIDNLLEFLTKIEMGPLGFTSFSWPSQCPWEDQVSNKDGIIDTHIDFPAEEKLKWAFRLYDLDGSGRVEQDEFETIFETLCK